MRIVTRYVSDDNYEFRTKEDCISRDELIKKTNAIMSVLQARPDGCSFTNGEGYLKHDVYTIKTVKMNLLELAKEYTDHKIITQTIENIDGIHLSWVGRVLGESDLIPLSRAWGRFNCMDKDGCEYGQPYFVEHKSEVIENLIEDK